MISVLTELKVANALPKHLPPIFQLLGVFCGKAWYCPEGLANGLIHSIFLNKK